MKFKNVRPTDHGLVFDVEATNQEVEYLTTFAVEQLLQQGILSLNPYEEEQEVDIPEVTH